MKEPTLEYPLICDVNFVLLTGLFYFIMMYFIFLSLTGQMPTSGHPIITTISL